MPERYDLKPCPFCGGRDIRCSFKVSGRFIKQYRVAMFCNDCHTYGPRVLTIKAEHNDYKGRDTITKDEKYEAAATEAWNRRAEYDNLSHGVTIATDNNVAYKLKATEPLTNCQRWIPVTERLPEAPKGE